MKKMTIVAACSAITLMLHTAHAQERNYWDEISGTAVPSSFDFNGDGVKAHYVTFSGLSTLGPVHGGFLVEYDFQSVAPHPDCPPTTVLLPIIVSASNRAVTLPHGQIYLRDDATSARFCLHPDTGAFTMSLKGVFTGGMGKYAGASGTYQYKGSGNVLLLDKSGMPFGGFTLRTEGKLIIPK